MTSLPEDERDQWRQPEESAREAFTGPPSTEPTTAELNPASDRPLPPANNAPADGVYAPWNPEPPRIPLPIAPLPIAEPPRSEQFEAASPSAQRIPNFGHLCILGLLLAFGALCTGIIVELALSKHFLGIANREQAATNVFYTLGSEVLLYLFALAACLVIFPLVWHKGFFAGVQWNAGTALRLRWRLISAAGACFLLAFVDSVVVPGPSNAPIDRIFREPGAAWLLFVFGITFAPFFEETFFRGFLLPALCTAYDWIGERTKNIPRFPLLENGHPQWSVGAMVMGSILTSLPFAALHAQQTGYSWGPFVLLVGVSLVLCAVRLSTRSLAASVLVHSSYNFILFAIMLVSTHGFRHMGKA